MARSADTRVYRDIGIVLRTYKLGEADRICVVFTEQHGKVRSVAKGVRKTRSKFGGRLEPTSHVSLQLYQGRGELEVVTQAETVDRFTRLRSDLDLFSRASALLEAVDQLTPDGHSDPALYRMLLGALRTLDDTGAPLVSAGFFLKLLAQEGVSPMVDACVSCGTEDQLVAIDLEVGGLTCQGCRRGRSVSPEAVELVQAVLGGRLGAALAEPVTAATWEVDQLATEAMERHLERRLRSIGVMGQAGAV